MQGYCGAGRCLGFYEQACPLPTVSSAPSLGTSRWVGVAEPAPASKYHAVTTVISYCADAGALPALLPRPLAGCNTRADSDPELPSQLPAPLPAGPQNSQPPGRTTALHTPALGEHEAPERGWGWQHQPSGSKEGGGSLITVFGERCDYTEHPPPSHAPPCSLLQFLILF